MSIKLKWWNESVIAANLYSQSPNIFPFERTASCLPTPQTSRDPIRKEEGTVKWIYQIVLLGRWNWQKDLGAGAGGVLDRLWRGLKGLGASTAACREQDKKGWDDAMWEDEGEQWLDIRKGLRKKIKKDKGKKKENNVSSAFLFPSYIFRKTFKSKALF